jgi:predicted Holliday junction resolvase-like endonuclease
VPRDGLLVQLAEFYKAARHLWGRCPHCDSLFRVSEAVITHGNAPPRDWLRRIEQRQRKLLELRAETTAREAELTEREAQVAIAQQQVERYRLGIEQDAMRRARELAKSKDGMAAMLRDARREGAERSRATLVGHVLERLAPFFRRFKHDARDFRSLMNPIDYVIFDGITARGEVERITFAEVKVGTSRPTGRQQSVAEAIKRGRVQFEQWQIGEAGVPIAHEIAKRVRMNS